jgi:ATP-dependent DNA helicase PIF1
MSRATARTNIKILALPPNAEVEEEQARRQEEKDAKKRVNSKGKKNNVVRKQKRVLPMNGTNTKNIVHKEVLTL